MYVQDKNGRRIKITAVSMGTVRVHLHTLIDRYSVVLKSMTCGPASFMLAWLGGFDLHKLHASS